MILPMAPGWKTGNLGKNRCHTYWAKIESILDSGQGMLQPALLQCCKTKIAISFHTLSSLWRSLMHVLFDMKRKAASGQKTAFYAKKKKRAIQVFKRWRKRCRMLQNTSHKNFPAKNRWAHSWTHGKYNTSHHSKTKCISMFTSIGCPVNPL